MIATVETPNGTYVQREMGEPVCGEDFCDGCGDCLACQWHEDAEWCNSGSSSFWVVYLTDEKNPWHAHNTGDRPQ